MRSITCRGHVTCAFMRSVHLVTHLAQLLVVQGGRGARENTLEKVEACKYIKRQWGVRASSRTFGSEPLVLHVSGLGRQCTL